MSISIENTAKLWGYWVFSAKMLCIVRTLSSALESTTYCENTEYLIRTYYVLQEPLTSCTYYAFSRNGHERQHYKKRITLDRTSNHRGYHSRSMCLSLLGAIDNPRTMCFRQNIFLSAPERCFIDSAQNSSTVIRIVVIDRYSTMIYCRYFITWSA